MMNKKRFLPALFAALSCFGSTTNAKEQIGSTNAKEQKGWSTGMLMGSNLVSGIFGGGIGYLIGDGRTLKDRQSAEEIIENQKNEITDLKRKIKSLEDDLKKQENKLIEEKMYHSQTKEKKDKLQDENNNLKIKYGKIPVNDLNTKAAKIKQIEQLHSLYKNGHSIEGNVFGVYYSDTPERIYDAMFNWKFDSEKRDSGLVTIANRLFLLNAIIDELNSNDDTNHETIKKTLQTNLDEVNKWRKTPSGVGNLDGLKKIWEDKFKQTSLTK